MSSGFTGGGGRDFYAFAGVGSSLGNPLQLPYPRSDPAAAASTGGLVAVPAGFGIGKRTLTEMERQQQQHIQHALLLRSVKQRSHQYYQASPISPLSPGDLDSNASSSSSGPPAVPLNGTFAFHKQQLQNQMQKGAVFGTAGGSGRGGGACYSSPPVPAARQVESDRMCAMKTRLEELEKHLLDDDNDNDGGGGAISSEWNETMRGLMISPVPPPPLPHQIPQATVTSVTHSPSPTPSCSSSSSSCSPSSSSSSTTSRQLLLDSAAAIAEANTQFAAATLATLRKTVNPRSADPEQRLSAYMVAALLSRINTSPPEASSSASPAAELCSAEHLMATQLLYEVSPCFKLGFLAANLAILDATRGLPKIHIVDFDIGQGGQYLLLLDALASDHRSRSSSSPAASPSAARPTVRITAVAEPHNPYTTNTSLPACLKAAGDRLAKLAESVGIPFRFSVVSRRASELNRSSLGADPDDALVVNLAFHVYKVPDESVTPANPRDELLRRVKGLNPTVVTVVEQEMNGNTTPFLARFAEASGYYGALFESLEARMPVSGGGGGDRGRVEECLGRKAANSVAQEGPDRVERCEVFGKWRARMGMAGFRSSPLGPGVAVSVRARLASFRAANTGFDVKEEGGVLFFGWMGRALTVASAWR